METKPPPSSPAHDSIEAFDLPEDLCLENVLEKFRQLHPGECLRLVDDADPTWICALLKDKLRERILIREHGRRVDRNHYVALVTKHGSGARDSD